MNPTLNPDQQKAISLIEKNRFVVLKGSPGTGKSFVIRTLLGRSDFGPILVVALANAALANYPHEHVANFARVKARLSKKGRGKPDLLGKFSAAVSVGRPALLVIDEAFLMSSKDLAELDALLCTLRRSKIMPFGGIRRMVLVGDPGQLKPIGGESITSFSRFGLFKPFELTTNRRFEDADYANLLKNVGVLLRKTEDGEIVHPEIEPTGQLFEAFVRQVKRKACSGATIVGWRRKDVTEATAQSKGITLRPSGLGSNASDRDREETVVPVGTPVRIKTNPMVKETGTAFTPEGSMVYNGRIGVFCGIVDSDGDEISSETINVGPDRLVRIKIGSETVVLEPSRPYSLAGKGKGHVVQIEPAHGMTVVSAQGSTLPNGIHFVASEKMKIPVDQLLVALQRVPTPDRVSISENVNGIRWPSPKKRRV